MTVIIGIIFFIFGAVIGSFLNVCILRIPEKQSINYPPSHCCSCGARLRVFDLIPIISYLSLHRKCRYCDAPISAQYVCVETLMAVIATLTGLVYGPTLYSLLLVAFFAALLVIALIDLHHMYVPDGGVLLLLAMGVLHLLTMPFSRNLFLDKLGGALLGSGALILVALFGFAVFKKESMGMGDIKLLFSIGFFFGLRGVILCLYFSFIFGAVVALLLLLFKKKDIASAIPFVPYIAMGTIVVGLFSTQIWSAYLTYLMGGG